MKELKISYKRLCGVVCLKRYKDIFKIKGLMINEYGFTVENDSIYQR